MLKAAGKDPAASSPAFTGTDGKGNKVEVKVTESRGGGFYIDKYVNGKHIGVEGANTKEAAEAKAKDMLQSHLDQNKAANSEERKFDQRLFNGRAGSPEAQETARRAEIILNMTPEQRQAVKEGKTFRHVKEGEGVIDITKEDMDYLEPTVKKWKNRDRPLPAAKKRKDL